MQPPGACSQRMTKPDVSPTNSVYDVAIIGAGFSGICMGIKLREAGISNFVIMERAEDAGGTWRANDYPGCACDIPSHLYSFSFEPKADLSCLFPRQPEIQDYLLHCVEKYGLRAYIRMHTNLDQAVYDDAKNLWRLSSSDGETFFARALVSGMGGLSRPAIPALPGLDTFEGTTFHSAQWNHDYDLGGKKVAVIGTGASAIQFVPQIVDAVGQLVLFQRTPPWIVPRPDRHIFGWEKWLYRHFPLTQRLFRTFIYWRQEVRGIGFTISPKLMQKATKIALQHLQKSVADPGLRQDLTPDYTIGCKRILISNDYYPALQEDNLTLVRRGIRQITRDGIIDDHGHHHSVDAIIFGTGFHATDPLKPTRIFGLGGRELADDWKQGPEAFLGISVNGYPNMFLLMGPNTGLGHNSMIFMIEAQVRYTLRILQRLLSGRVAAYDVKAGDQAAFNKDLQDTFAGTVWASGCDSWYQTAAGRQTVLWPGFTFSYWFRTRRPDLSHYTVTER